MAIPTIPANNTTSVTTSTLPGSENLATGASVPGAGYATGLSGPVTATKAIQGYNYTYIIQIPVPFLSLNLNLRDLLGHFVLPAIAKMGVPKAVASYMAKANKKIQKITADVQALIRSIPEASVTLLIKVGPAVVANLQFYAEKQPINVPIPTFVLALPNLALNPNFTLPFPAPPPVKIGVPVPIPIVKAPVLPTITGGNVSASAQASVSPQTQGQPFQITSPIKLPPL